LYCFFLPAFRALPGTAIGLFIYIFFAHWYFILLREFADPLQMSMRPRSSFAPRKYFTSALTIIPPKQYWAPIQAIREKHDRAFNRWMPHINMYGEKKNMIFFLLRRPLIVPRT
jgi:hypothetical protein